MDMPDLTILLVMLITLGLVTFGVLLWQFRPERRFWRHTPADPEPGPEASLMKRYRWQIRNKTPEQVAQWEKDHLPPAESYAVHRQDSDSQSHR